MVLNMYMISVENEDIRSFTQNYEIKSEQIFSNKEKN